MLEKFEKVQIIKDNKVSNGIIIETYPHNNVIVLDNGDIVELNENETTSINSLNRKIETKDLMFPKLNGLSAISIESTMIKLAEEVGELAQVVGKGKALSGERDSLSDKDYLNNLISELLDVAQTTTSMLFVLEDKYNINIIEFMEEHYKKLIKKGYIK